MGKPRCLHLNEKVVTINIFQRPVSVNVAWTTRAGKNACLTSSCKSDVPGSRPQLTKVPLASHKETRTMRLWRNSDPVLHWALFFWISKLLTVRLPGAVGRVLSRSWQKHVCGVLLLALMKPASPFLVHSALPWQRYLASIREREPTPSHVPSALKPSLFLTCVESWSLTTDTHSPTLPRLPGIKHLILCVSSTMLPGQSRYFTHRQDTEEFYSQTMKVEVKLTL